MKDDSDQPEDVHAQHQQQQQTRNATTALKAKEEDAAEAARRRESEETKARERWKADWIKAVMGATVILVPTIILVFFFVTFSLVEPEKKVGSDARQVTAE